jgi:hypothetical protein
LLTFELASLRACCSLERASRLAKRGILCNSYYYKRQVEVQLTTSDFWKKDDAKAKAQ